MNNKQQTPDEGLSLNPFIIKDMVRQQFDDPIARGVIITLCRKVAEAQLAKAKPIIEKQERERIATLIDEIQTKHARIMHIDVFDDLYFLKQELKERNNV